MTIISRSGRVFEIVNYWQIWLVNPPLRDLGESRGHDITGKTIWTIDLCVSKSVDRPDSNSLYHIVSGWMGMIKPQSTQRTQSSRTER
ncbi:hypothetical protein QUB12_25560 [Microcoleus sp. B7-D4]